MPGTDIRTARRLLRIGWFSMMTEKRLLEATWDARRAGFIWGWVIGAAMGLVAGMVLG